MQTRSKINLIQCNEVHFNEQVFAMTLVEKGPCSAVLPIKEKKSLVSKITTKANTRITSISAPDFQLNSRIYIRD